MKKSKITLLVASLLGLAVGVGGAFAATQFVKGEQHVNTTFDQSVYLYWGAGQEDVTIDNVTDLKSGTNQYRYVTCNPAASASYTGKVRLTYTIAGQIKDAKTYSLEGLTVNVYAGVTKPVSGDPDVSEVTPDLVLVFGTTNTGTTDFNVTLGTGSENYCLEFVYDGSPAATGHEWGGLMTISQALV